MLSYKDKTFCSSPDCTNACGRKLTEAEEMDAKQRNLPIAFAYFCGLPREAYVSIKENEAPE